MRSAAVRRRVNRPAAAALLLGYVAGASYFGLTGGDPTSLGADAWRSMRGTWRESFGADVVFVVGMAATGVSAWRLAMRGRGWASAIVGLVGAYATFCLAFAWVSAKQGSDVVTMAPFGLVMVIVAGWMGLLFAAAAPVAAASLWRRTRR